MYDTEDVGATLASQTGGLGGAGVSLIIDDELSKNKRKEDENLTNTQTNIFEFLNEEETVEKRDFTFVELFAGIGGVSFGLEQVGGRCLLAAEWDPVQEGKTQFAQESYKVLHPDTSITGNVMDLDKDNTPDHDVLTATFPCQAFSVAGKRGGFEDARGTLFFEVARIANEKKPKVILAENVKGLVGHDKGKTLDTIVKTLNEIGYRVDFEVLNSKYFGVPQNRERIFVVAVREDLVDNAPWNIVGNTIVPKGKRRISGYDDVKTFNFDWPTNDTVELRLKDVLEPSVDEKYYLSEEKTAQLVTKLEDKSFEDSEDSVLAGEAELKGHEAIRRVYSQEGVSPTLTTMGGGHREPKVAEPNGINLAKQASEVAGLTDVAGTLMARDYKGFGNKEKTGVIEGLPIKEATKKGYAEAYEGDAVNIMFPNSETRRGRVGKDGQAQTLEASGCNQGVVESAEGAADRTRNGSKTLESNGEEYANAITSVQHDSMAIEKPQYRIRKLTPLECWRLQGFTDEQHNAVEDAGISNSQRYKQSGNAVTVNVIKAIGERLLPYL